jgi:hypothetical protein
MITFFQHSPKTYFFYWLLCACLWAPKSVELLAQSSKLDNLQVNLWNMGTELAIPADSDYKLATAIENPYLPYQHAIRSSKENLEIRFYFQPESQNTPFPQVESYRLAMHMGNNEQTIFSARELTTYELDSVFHADWGRVYLFTPKAGFSIQKYCKMLTLHRENKGVVYVIFLFDKPSALIDERLHILRYW